DPAIETVVTASTNNPAGANPGAEDLIRVLAANVTLDGLVIDGNNPALGASAQQIGGVDVHARRGITNVDAADDEVLAPGLLVQDCIVQNIASTGIWIFNGGPVTHGVIRRNVFARIGERAILMWRC